MTYNNLNMSVEEIHKLFSMEHVHVVPSMKYSFKYESDRMYYQIGGIPYACKKDCVLSMLKNQRQTVFVPMLIEDSALGSDGIVPEATQKLYFQQALNIFSRYLYIIKYGSDLPSIVRFTVSTLNNSYEKDIIATIYFLDDIEDGEYEKVRSIHNHFITKGNLKFSTVSPTGVNIKLSKRDKINMYDIVKYSNYIKLKGYGDNTLYLDLEIDGKTFNPFNVKPQLLELMGNFFED